MLKFIERLYLIVILTLLSMPIFATEPTNHLGWTLSELRSSFPQLVKVEEKNGVVVYGQGVTTDGMVTYYVLADNVVFQEKTIFSSRDSTSRKLFNLMVKDVYMPLYSDKIVSKDDNYIQFKFETFIMDIIYYEDKDYIKRTMIQYRLIVNSK